MRTVSYLLISVAWIVIMAVLAAKHYFPPVRTGSSQRAIPQELFGERWMGVYFNDEKVGYARRSLFADGQGYSLDEFLMLRINVLGEIKDIETSTSAALSRNLELRAFSVVMRSDTSVKAEGRVEGTELTIAFETGTVKTERTLRLKEVPALNLSLVPRLVQAGLEPGTSLKLPVFDPLTLSEQQASVEVKGMEEVTALGGRWEAYRIDGSAQGRSFTLWVTAAGEIIAEENDLGFRLVREEKEAAVSVGRPSLDLIARVSVPVRTQLPGTVSYLKIRISGIEAGGLDLNGGRQKLDGDILEISMEDLEPVVASESDAGPDGEYLEPSLSVQSRDPRIRSVSAKITGNERNPRDAAGLIAAWVYENMEKVPAVTVPLSTDILKTMKGDCNEHAVLFTALSRAAGIPSRISLGLAYRDGSFFYHAWPEVFAGGWIAIDPTFGQFPADAAHVRLITGDMDEMARLIPVVGKIGIEVLDYRE